MRKLLLLIVVTLVIQGCKKVSTPSENSLLVPISFSGTQITKASGQITSEPDPQDVEALVIGSLTFNNWETVYTYRGKNEVGNMITAKAFGKITFNTASTAENFAPPVYYPPGGDSIYIKALAPYSAIKNIDAFQQMTDTVIKFEITGNEDVMTTGKNQVDPRDGVGNNAAGNHTIAMEFEHLLSKINFSIVDGSHSPAVGDDAEAYWGKISQMWVSGITKFHYNLGESALAHDLDLPIGDFGNLMIFVAKDETLPLDIKTGGVANYAGSVMVYPSKTVVYGETGYWSVGIYSDKGQNRVINSALVLEGGKEYDILLTFWKSAVIQVVKVNVKDWVPGEEADLEIK